MVNYRTVVLDNSPAQLRVDAFFNTAPAHAPGKRVIVGISPSGVFAGHANSIAWSDGETWFFDIPEQGWKAYVCSLTEEYVFHSARWQPTILIEAKGDIIVGGLNGIPQVLSIPAIDFGKHYFLSAYQEEAPSQKEFYYEKLQPPFINFNQKSRLLGSNNDGKTGQEFELGAGLAFSGNKVIATAASSPYYYFNFSEINQPFTSDPGHLISNQNSGYLFLHKHGIATTPGAYFGSFELLFHCYHQISSSRRIVVSASKTVEFSIYIEQLTGQYRDVSSLLKVTQSSGSYAELNPQLSGAARLVSWGLLPDDAVLLSFDPFLSSGKPEYERLKITNKIGAFLQADYGASNYPMYTKYKFNQNHFVSPQTTHIAEEEK